MDNTVGSLNQLQRSVLIGTILGDGYIRIIPGRKNAFLEVNHTIDQKEYVDWKYKIFKDFVKSPPKSRRGKGNRTAYRFFTRQHPDITQVMNTFYDNKIKCIPKDFEIDPIVLAVWFMDDGSKCRESDVYINTQQFDIVSQNRLIEALNKYNLEAKLNRDKHYFRIRFLKSSLKKFNQIIKPYIIPEMKYKLIYDPVETTRRTPTISDCGMMI